MNDLNEIAKRLKKKQNQTSIVYNYTIPQTWNTFGYEKGICLKNNEMIVDPYDFYAFALNSVDRQMRKLAKRKKDQGKQGNWIKSEILYDLDLKTFSGWDHDRSEHLEQSDLYALCEQGTFLKAIILLPLLKRAGITALILHHYLALDTSRTPHDFSDPHAILHPLKINEELRDPLLESMSAEQQFQLFIDVAHRLHMHVLGEFPSARMGRNNLLLWDHPDWFYWIRKEEEANYHPPKNEKLPFHCIPNTNACDILYESKETKQHLSKFVTHPETKNHKKKPKSLDYLSQIETQFHCTSAPTFSDVINAELPIQTETTLLRFFEDQPCDQAPYLLQDTMRPDLFCGQQRKADVWEMIVTSATAWIKDFNFDGFYISEAYHYPRELLKEAIHTLRKHNRHAAIIVEETLEDQAKSWLKIGVDMISGASAYSIHDIRNYTYHNFAYSRYTAPISVLAASEFRDTPRITQYEGNETLAKLFMFMNLFLPQTVPYLASGQLSLERHPQQLSPYCDHRFLEAQNIEDARLYRQSLLDISYYSYTRKDHHILINQLEQFSAIRNKYIHAITDLKHCVPVWFDDPKDDGIGFTYMEEDKALLVVCNVNVHTQRSLNIHTENMLEKLPFVWRNIRQIYSSHNPFIQDVKYDAFHNIPLLFEPGEVKCLEITKQ
ncbi:MAG: hypothetical protein HFF02_07420 [Erysipelotrichaceae bacterium]|nr:hypothetical protein [Erysipelotrichaceae bacterium]